MGKSLITSAIGIGSLLFFMLGSGYQYVTYHPPFLPVNFLIDSDGLLFAEFDPTIHTFIGDFGYEYQIDLVKTKRHFLYVTLINQNWPDGEKYKVYKLDLQKNNVELWINSQPMVARIVISSDGLVLDNRGVEYIKYDGHMLWIDMSDGVIKDISFHPERDLIGRLVAPSSEINKFCRASKERGHAPPLITLVCIGDMTEAILGFFPRLLVVLFGDIAGSIIGFWFEFGILVFLIWQVGKHTKPIAYLSLSLLFIWVLLAMLRVWPDILF